MDTLDITEWMFMKEKVVFFFYDHSVNNITDPDLKKLLGRSNVLITPHQGFATTEALQNIAKTTFENLDAWTHHRHSGNKLTSFVT